MFWHFCIDRLHLLLKSRDVPPRGTCYGHSSDEDKPEKGLEEEKYVKQPIGFEPTTSLEFWIQTQGHRRATTIFRHLIKPDSLIFFIFEFCTGLLCKIQVLSSIYATILIKDPHIPQTEPVDILGLYESHKCLVIVFYR